MKVAIFPNSQEHRRRLRTWQSLMCLFPTLRHNDFSQRLPVIWKRLGEESVASTRHYIEWYLILGICKFADKNHLTNLLSRMMEYDQGASTSISTLTIVMHVGVHLSECNAKDQKKELYEYFYGCVFDRMLPWFIHNSHMARLYALFVFERLWKLQNLPTPNNLPKGYQNMAAFIEMSDQCKKFLQKIANDPIMTSFHPLEDFSLEMIFSGIGRMSDVALDECSISRFSFENIDARPLSIALGEPRAPDLPLAESIPPSPPPALNSFVFQQKIDPWNFDSSLDQDIRCAQREQEMKRKSSTSFDVIVVASLVDRIPNLAGLSRTCEIMGASCLTIPKASIKDEADFRGISMTSEKWLNIIEVCPKSLQEYLMQKRKESYTIIAVEQSSTSQMLNEYRFPARICLVLGGESKGIPVEILHLVDDCIEIPQFGMIRSLNVHVTGSIVLWEARRQHFENIACND